MNTSSGNAANLKRDIYTGDFVSDDIEDAPEVGNARDVLQQAGLLKNKNQPVQTARQVKMRQMKMDPQNQEEYDSAKYYSGYNNVEQSARTLSGLELAKLLKEKMGQLARSGMPQSYVDGVKDAVADVVHGQVYSYIRSGGSQPYPDALVKMFLQGGTYSIAGDYPNEVGEMLKDLGETNPQAQAPEEEEPTPLHKSVYVVDPATNQDHVFDNPQDLKVAYDKSNQASTDNEKALANAIKSAVITAAQSDPAGYKDYLQIVSGPEGGLRMAASQAPPVQAAPVAPQWSNKFDDDDEPQQQQPQAAVPQMAQPAAMQPAPQQAPHKTNTVVGLTRRLKPQVPQRPFPGPNDPTKMESFSEYRLRKTRVALMEGRSSKA